MGDGSVLILSGEEVAEACGGRELEILEAVRAGYRAHGRGESVLPHSTFLRFPGDEMNRIIALPAYLGDGFGVAGVKWIASFPGNIRHGLARASAVLILNSTEDGQPEVVLEGSLVSAKRTAASAAAAAAALLGGRAPEVAGLVGAGVIQRETARFLALALPGLDRFLVHDLDAGRAGRLAEALARSGARAEVAPALAEVLTSCPLVSFATTAVRPHVHDLSRCPAGAVILHVSLRDLSPELLLHVDNIVDDPDHVCRAETSLHLAERLAGNRDFIRCTLADILDGRARARRDPTSLAVFNPFGLGVLDLAVGQLVARHARAAGRGLVLPGFIPASED
ncbi:MAG TPA: 2,3-diaminopropionate biosynthesis protein SbnB [Thermoanaerobaculia bacterium]|nr:2,3-diaminopropionate biosynthesis protein SbnB [Thermoanaerobaculia bacterium]